MKAYNTKEIKMAAKLQKKMNSGNYFITKREDDFSLPFAVERGEGFNFRKYIYNAVYIERLK